MRATLRHLASTGKTVFISSHILGEVQQLADVVGIVAAGKLVREGPMAELLHGESVVRVRVAPSESRRRDRASGGARAEWRGRLARRSRLAVGPGRARPRDGG